MTTYRDKSPADLHLEAFSMEMADTLVARDSMTNEDYARFDVKRGLRNADGTGVVVGLTRIGNVFGYTRDENGHKVPAHGKLYYRGYSVEELVQACMDENRFGFEEISYLLIFGKLPTRHELESFCRLLGSKRELPHGFARDMIMTAPSRSIMNKVARSVLASYSYDPNPDDISVENIIRQSMELMGYFPAFIAYAYQAKSLEFDNMSLHLHYPVPELSTAENILHMLRPLGEFTDTEAKILDVALMLHAEHGGGNNSTFATHLVSSAGTDTYSAISAAMASLKGPRHGGANISVMNMVRDLKENVKDYTDDKQLEDYFIKVLKGEANDGTGLIYGLGHAIYTLSDPRAVMLHKMAVKLAKEKGLEDDLHICEFLDEHGSELFAKVTGVEKPVPANVDLYSGFVYTALNVPQDVATPLFALARLSGWCAHRLEEVIAGGKLIRPAYATIQPVTTYVPLLER